MKLISLYICHSIHSFWIELTELSKSEDSTDTNVEKLELYVLCAVMEPKQQSENSVHLLYPAEEGGMLANNHVWEKCLSTGTVSGYSHQCLRVSAYTVLT